MKLLFCLFKYFPFGGLQRDFRRIAQICLERGHAIDVATTEWSGDIPPGMSLSVLPVKGFANHQRCLSFANMVAGFMKYNKYDAVVGFNKIPGLDVYFAADPCYKAKVLEGKGFLYRLTPRYRTYAALEKSVFDPAARTRILLISEREREKFIRCYNTPVERFHSLPPGISRDRVAPPDAETIRRALRSELGIPDDVLLLLMVGSSFTTKGLDRSILAIAGLPEALRKKVRLLVIGEGDQQPFIRLAKRKHISDQLLFMGGRNDVPRFLLGADLLLHPAYTENTGTVLVEAMASGLPVLATEICGYSSYVKEAEAGLLIPSPFRQQTFNDLLQYMLSSQDRMQWGKNGIAYTTRTDVFSMPEKAADIIEAVAVQGRLA
ncbi:MAG: glycosyltransferase family 4 protein [Nitrospirota bacterium]